jgi:hypothetical protein
VKVLVACERSGIVREAFRALGHDARSCDLVRADDGSQFHIVGDALQVARSDDWDLVIAHPPCTRLCLAGVRWLHERHLWGDLTNAARFFRAFLDLPAARIAVENPVMHGHALRIVGRRADQFVQPWMFGHGETKRTGFWLKGLPLLKPTRIVHGRKQRIWRMPPDEHRARIRSLTYSGIARAMASQWGRS